MTSTTTSSCSESHHRVIFTFIIACSTIIYLSVTRKQRKTAMWQRKIRLKKISYESDLGKVLGLDLGGSLAKLVYFEQLSTTPFMRRPRSASHHLASHEMRSFISRSSSLHETSLAINNTTSKLGGTLHFLHFESQHIVETLDVITNVGLNQSVRRLSCTGGGAYKHQEMFKTAVNIDLLPHDELDCTIIGLNFLLSLVPDEAYTFDNVDFKSMTADKRIISENNSSSNHQLFPYLLVSIGSGVSILHVKSSASYERISGSSLGGGTFWGLVKTLTDVSSYDEALEMATSGNNFGVDMSVGDIYGTVGYEKFNLPATTVASTFGKVNAVLESNGVNNKIDQRDIARALLIMVTQNIGQIAYLNACLCNASRIFFVGNFLRHNMISSRMLAYAINFWSAGSMEAQFVKHEGYLGAMGAFLVNVENQRKNSSSDSSSRL